MKWDKKTVGIPPHHLFPSEADSGGKEVVWRNSSEGEGNGEGRGAVMRCRHHEANVTLVSCVACG